LNSGDSYDVVDYDTTTAIPVRLPKTKSVSLSGRRRALEQSPSKPKIALIIGKLLLELDL
jgi:hypothetical protein